MKTNNDVKNDEQLREMNKVIRYREYRIGLMCNAISQAVKRHKKD